MTYGVLPVSQDKIFADRTWLDFSYAVDHVATALPAHQDHI
jgi:hypothetical protein